jgi:hypothetical protein
MRKKLKIHNGHVITDLYILLNNIPENILYFHEHALRHPLAIYNISKGRVIDAFNDVINALKNSSSYDSEIENLDKMINDLNSQLENKSLNIGEYEDARSQLEEKRKNAKSILGKRNDELKDLLNKQKELLDSMMAFIDDSYHIMKCFYPANSVRKEIADEKEMKFADKWMEQVEKKLIKEYKKRINKYRSHLAPIVNKIKHNHARLNFIQFKTIHGEIKGYFVEGVDKNGTIGPDREIHKLFRNSDTAISLNFDLKYHLVNFIHLCHHLKAVLEKIIKRQHGLTLNLINNGRSEKDIDVKTIESIRSLPYLFFPDEQYKPLPEIILTEQSAEFILPSNSPKPLNYDSGKISFIFTADGVSKTFRLPYWHK